MGSTAQALWMHRLYITACSMFHTVSQLIPKSPGYIQGNPPIPLKYDDLQFRTLKKKSLSYKRESEEMFMFILFWRKQSSAFVSSECLWIRDYICATRFPCNSASCFPQTIKSPQTACQVVIVPWPPLATKFEATEKFWQLLWNDVTNHFHVLTFKV